MKKAKEKEQVRIPKGAFYSDRDCCRCMHVERSPGSNSGWWCSKKRTHVRPGIDECGYFESR